MDKKTLKILKENGGNHHPEEYRIVRNCLLILKVINDGHEVSRNDLAEICGGVSKRTIDRYLVILRDIGYNVSYNSHSRCYEIKNNDDVDLSYIY